MTAVPLLRPAEVVNAFERLGRSCPAKGKPYHPYKTRAFCHPFSAQHSEVARGTLRSLISKAGLTIEDFLAALKEN